MSVFDYANISRLNEELQLKDEAIAQLRRELVRIATLQEIPKDRGSSSLLDAVRLENQQLVDQLEMKDQFIERLGHELRVRQEMYEKYAATFRDNSSQVEINLSRELDREIELSTKLKSEVDRVSS